MTFKVPFQSKLFYDSMIVLSIIYPTRTLHYVLQSASSSAMQWLYLPSSSASAEDTSAAPQQAHRKNESTRFLLVLASKTGLFVGYHHFS